MKYQTKIVDGVEVCFSADWINDLESEIHFSWYWNQANIVYSNCNRDQKILEIGVGTSFLSDLLRRRGWNIITLDIDQNKNPDFCASAADFDYCAHQIDAILAFEIFEHIPFLTFEKLVTKLALGKINSLYFSLPWHERNVAHVELKLPKIKKINWSISIPKGNSFPQAHFWELASRNSSVGGKQLVTTSALQSLFESHGYVIKTLNKFGYIQFFSAKLKKHS